MILVPFIVRALTGRSSIGGARTPRACAEPGLRPWRRSRLFDLAKQLKDYSASLNKEADKLEFTAASTRCTQLGISLQSWVRQEVEGSVYWTERSGNERTGGRFKNTKLVSCPIDVGPILRDELFAKVPTVILTSATLSTGRENFEYAKARIGLTKSLEKTHDRS